MPTRQRILWVVPDDLAVTPADDARHRAGLMDQNVPVEIMKAGRWKVVTIPAGARDEWGGTIPQLNIAGGELPPEGRVFIVDAD